MCSPTAASVATSHRRLRAAQPFAAAGASLEAALPPGDDDAPPADPYPPGLHGGASPEEIGQAFAELQPHGEVDVTNLSEKFSREEGIGYVMGNHPAATPMEALQFKAMLAANRDCFAFSLADLQGGYVAT
jgi:hypothetical protein